MTKRLESDEDPDDLGLRGLGFKSDQSLNRLDSEETPSRFIKGCLIGLVIAVALWAVLIMVFILLTA